MHTRQRRCIFKNVALNRKYKKNNELYNTILNIRFQNNHMWF